MRLVADDAGELTSIPVAGGFERCGPVLGDRGINQLCGDVSPQSAEVPFLVGTRSAGCIGRDIGGVRMAA